MTLTEIHAKENKGTGIKLYNDSEKTSNTSKEATIEEVKYKIAGSTDKLLEKLIKVMIQVRDK